MKVALRESADAAEAAQALMRDFFETAAAEAVTRASVSSRSS